MESETQTTTAGGAPVNETSHIEMATEQLDEVVGGLQFTFKLVAVKTISWAHDS